MGRRGIKKQQLFFCSTLLCHSAEAARTLVGYIRPNEGWCLLIQDLAKAPQFVLRSRRPYGVWSANISRAKHFPGNPFLERDTDGQVGVISRN
jgi:hypothetical protein